MSVGSGIKLTSGFDLNSKSPLDNRTLFETINERDLLPSINLYEGLICYVKEVKENFQYIDGKWQEFKSSGGDVSQEQVNIIQNEINDIKSIKYDDVEGVKDENGYTILTFKANGVDKKTITIENINNENIGLYHIGSEPPDDINMMWIDTSEGGIDLSFDSIIINELRLLISAMQNRIDKLEADVEYLKINGGGSGGDTSELIILEDGDYLITESGEFVALESSVVAETFNILTQLGENMITEDDNNLILEV